MPAPSTADPDCQNLSGRCLDQAVTALVLAALEPAALEISIRAVEQAATDRAALEKIWAQRLERARIDVERAERCYRLAEPENRLVTRTLEKDWEQALARVSEDLEASPSFPQVQAFSIFVWA